MAKKKTPKTYVYIVHTDDRKGITDDEAFIDGVYKSKASATDALMDEVESNIGEIYCEFAYIEPDKETSWGDWDDLPETAKDKTEDDEYSKEEILALIRKHGYLYIEDEDGESYEVSISKFEVEE